MTAAEDTDYTLRMRDLCESSGLGRQVIHFYIQRGLLPPGHKTGRNTAFYGQVHIDRLHAIQKLKDEQFLPLKAIKAVLDGKQGDFSSEQQKFLAQVQKNLNGPLRTLEHKKDLVPMADVLALPGVEREDVNEAISLGTVAASEDRSQVSRRDMWMLELFGAMREIGFSSSRGFRVADIAFYEKAIAGLFHDELELVSTRLSGLPPKEAAAMIERALPVIHTFMNRYHTDRVRDFFDAVGLRQDVADTEPGDSRDSSDSSDPQT